MNASFQDTTVSGYGALLSRLGIGLAVLAAPMFSYSQVTAGDAAPVEKVVVKAVARFGFDGTSMTAADRQAMLAEVSKIKDVTWRSVTATGHTDSVGSAAYNQRLSAKRAAAVKTYLVGNGISADMVRTKGLASKAPVASNADEDGRALNRRAEVEFQGVRVSAK